MQGKLPPPHWICGQLAAASPRTYPTAQQQQPFPRKIRWSTRSRPAGDEVYGHQAYRNSVISAPMAAIAAIAAPPAWRPPSFPHQIAVRPPRRGYSSLVGEFRPHSRWQRRSSRNTPYRSPGERLDPPHRDHPTRPGPWDGRLLPLWQVSPPLSGSPAPRLFLKGAFRRGRTGHPDLLRRQGASIPEARWHRALVVSRRKAYPRKRRCRSSAGKGTLHPPRRSIMIGNRPPAHHPDLPPTAAEARSRPGCLFLSHRRGRKPGEPSNRVSDRPAMMAFRSSIDAVACGRRAERRL